MGESVFHKIMRREIPSEIVFEDEQCIAIRDIQPVSPTHLLVIPRKTIPDLDALLPEDRELIGHLVLTAQRLAREAGINGSGYRLVCNCGDEGGQTVPQLHIHVLGGRQFGWPPG